MLCQRVIGIRAGDLEYSILQHDNTQRTKGHAGRDLNFIHVVNLERAGLLDPIFEKGIPQGVFRFGLREVSSFDYETIFAHVATQSRLGQLKAGSNYSKD